MGPPVKVQKWESENVKLLLQRPPLSKLKWERGNVPYEIFLANPRSHFSSALCQGPKTDDLVPGASPGQAPGKPRASPGQAPGKQVEMD